MDIDWTQIRGAIARIEQQLARAQKVVETTESEIVRDWPEVRREDLEAAFPNWRAEYGSDWTHDFMEKKIGRLNYRFRRGSKTYRISPEVFRTLNLGGEAASRDRAPAEEDGVRKTPAG